MTSDSCAERIITRRAAREQESMRFAAAAGELVLADEIHAASLSSALGVLDRSFFGSNWYLAIVCDDASRDW